MNEDLLNQLANQYGSDKGTTHPHANKYMGLYAEYFARQGFDPLKVERVLEIGTNKGASLRVWADVFPNAEVHGIDITRQYEIPELLNHPRVHTHIVDSGDAIALTKAVHKLGVFDIIIDDGSHDQSDQQVAWGVLFHYLKSGGLYVIEDIITGEPWWDGNVYNKRRVRPTRDIVRELQTMGNVALVGVIPEDEWDYIIRAYSYCEYRESPAIIYQSHHPQVAFIGKK